MTSLRHADWPPGTWILHFGSQWAMTDASQRGCWVSLSVLHRCICPCARHSVKARDNRDRAAQILHLQIKKWKPSDITSVYHDAKRQTSILSLKIVFIKMIINLINETDICNYKAFLSFFFFFFWDRVSLCRPCWSAVVWSQLTATSTSWVQEILRPHPPK